ncbi:MAG: YdcF family protein [Clostridia bacterium]|nr:YdcF family protein [Clostridia bacterium]
MNALIVTFRSNFNVGILLTWLLAAVMTLCGIFFTWWTAHLPLWLRVLFFALLAALLVFVVFLYVYGQTDTVTYDEDAVIVLGAGIHGERLSLTLKNRLDAALAYHCKNPDALIVVSGGQGPQENITEGLAMERYLLENGVPAGKILREERATSTRENFLFSMAVLEANVTDCDRVAFVSNDYHIYRAELIARTAGLETVTHTHNATPWYTVVPSGLRECLAVVKAWILS